MSIPGLPAESKRVFRYVGSKIRITPIISKKLHDTGATAVLDLFGGSGAVVMNSGFRKRVYNDIDGDIVHFFRVLADPDLFSLLLEKLKQIPMSRAIYEEERDIYVDGGNSFSHVKDKVERARMIFYRSSFAFGGKIKNGGFAVTLSDRCGVKELKRYFNVIQELEPIADFWRNTVIENLDYQKAIKIYGGKDHIVIYADPPYYGTERYYSNPFTEEDHSNLAILLNETPKAVVSYYDFPGVRELYPTSEGWEYLEIKATKNSMGRAKSKAQSTELIITKGLRPDLFTSNK